MIVRILKMMIVQNFKSSKTISLIHCSLKSFHIRLDCFVSWCWCSVAFELSNAISLLSNVLKTTKSFYRMISKRFSFLRSNFLKFFHWLRFLFRVHLVHAKTTLSDDREYYRKCDDDRWEWSANVMTNFRSQSERIFVLVDLIARLLRSLLFVFICLYRLFSSNSEIISVIIISCLSRWNYWRYARELSFMNIHALLRMLCLLLSIVLYQCFSRKIDVVVACLNLVEMFKL
jgi:hypothetical protein